MIRVAAAAILLVGLALRCYGLTRGFQELDEWGLAQFAVYAQNYVKLGLVQTRLLPLYGLVGDQPMAYVNHPFLGSTIVGVWALVFGTSEAAIRTFALLWAALTGFVIYRLGRQLWSPAAGLYAAGLYAVLPMAIHLGRMYTMESPCLTLTLLATSWLIDWSRGANRLLPACLALAAATQCDYYAAFLSPWLLLMGLKQRKPGYLCAAASPWLSLALFLVYVRWAHGVAELARGGSKYLQLSIIWRYVGDAGYHARILGRILRYHAYLPVLLALWQLPRERRNFWWLGLLASLPALDYVVTARALDVHHYRVMFFTPLICLLAGAGLARLRPRLAGALVALSLLAGLGPLREYYTPLYAGDVESARTVLREATTEQDLLIGLPPHMTYYLNRLAVVPYHYAWGVPRSEDVLVLLRPFGRLPGYGRIILFTQFLTVDTMAIDYSQTFAGVPGWKAPRRLGPDIWVWERE